MYKLKVLYARPPVLLVYKPCFLLAQALLVCQHLKHVLWWLPQKLPGGLKRGEARNRLCLEEQAVCEPHCFLQARHLLQAGGVFQSISRAAFSCPPNEPGVLILNTEVPSCPEQQPAAPAMKRDWQLTRAAAWQVLPPPGA